MPKGEIRERCTAGRDASTAEVPATHKLAGGRRLRLGRVTGRIGPTCGRSKSAVNPSIFRAARPIQWVYLFQNSGLNGTAPALCDKEELVCENRCAEPWEALNDFTPSAAPSSARSGQRGPPTLLQGSSKPLPPAIAEVGSDLATGRAARRPSAPSLFSSRPDRPTNDPAWAPAPAERGLLED